MGNKISIDKNAKKLKKAAGLLKEAAEDVTRLKGNVESINVNAMNAAPGMNAAGLMWAARNNLTDVLEKEQSLLSTISEDISENAKVLAEWDSDKTTVKNKLKKAIKNSNEKAAQKKYNKLVELIGRKKAKKYISDIEKKLGVKVKISNGKIISIVSINKKRKNSTTLTNATLKSAKTSKKTKSKKSTEKDTKTSKKTKSKKLTSLVSGASMIAATRTGIKAEIKQVKADAKTQIANAKLIASDKKKQLEIEKNNKIAEINRKAAEEIEAIDPNEENAQEKIDAIKANAEKEVVAINEQYNNEVAQIDKDLKTKIESIENNRDARVADLNKQLDSLKSEKKVESVMKQKFSSATAGAATVATASTVSDDNVTASNAEMMEATGELSDAYEGKAYAIDQVNAEINDASSNQNVTESTPETSNNTTDMPIQVEQESVASPVNSEPQQTTVTESSNNEPTYTSSNYRSENNYVTNDGVRAGVSEQITETKPETSTDTGVDQSNVSSTIEKDSTTSTITDKNTDDDIVSIAGSDKTENKKESSSGLGTIIPVGLGIAATGAAAVAGVRYVKNRKQNEDMDETYDDENNDLGDSSSEYESIPSDSEYMRDDYLGPEGSTYTEVPDENSYTDAEELEEAAGMNDFSEDTALNDLN